MSGLQGRLRRDIENARWSKHAVDAVPEWECAAPVHLQTVCIRHLPADMSNEAERGAHNLRIADEVNRSGRAYVTPALLGGRQIIRVSIGAEPTERRHVEMVWAELRRAAMVK